MSGPLLIAAIGLAVVREGRPEEAAAFERRLGDALRDAPPGARPVRLIHRIEETAYAASRDAFAAAGAVDGGRAGIALGVDEGIDGIKARHSLAVRTEGPLGASPLHFPFTAPNAVAAQLAIALGIKGESATYCSGSLSGAHSLAHAREALLSGRLDAMLAGGATWVESEFLDGLSRAGVPGGGERVEGACILLLRRPSPGSHGAGPLLLGTGSAFGENDVENAVRAALEEAALSAAELGGARVAAARDGRAVGDALRRAGVPGSAAVSPWSGFHAASFPLAVAESLRRAPAVPGAPVLVVATDCLGGAAAAIVRSAGNHSRTEEP